MYFIMMVPLICLALLYPNAAMGMKLPDAGRAGHKDHSDPLDTTCDLIKHYHCDFFHDDPHCGTDQRTYRNMCEFNKTHCDLRKLHVAHLGACDTLTTTPTPTPTTTGGGGGGDDVTPTSSSPMSSTPMVTAKPGVDTVYQFFCHNLAHHQCGADQEIMCGSDGITYTNL